MSFDFTANPDIFSHIFYKNPVGMCIICPEGKYQEVNSRFCQILGYSSEEVVGSHVDRFTYPDDIHIDSEMSKRVFDGDIPFFQIEKRYIHKSGRVKWAQLYATVLRDDDGTPSCGIGIIQDIDIQKQYSDELKQKNNELKKLNQELDLFVYSTSHDLRAPLSSILGLLNLNRIESGDNYYIREIEKSITRMDTVIKQITDYARNSRLEIEKDLVNLKQIIEDCFENIRYLGSGEVRLDLDLESEFVDNIDYKRLYIILNNLISNAVKYKRNGKEQSYIKVSQFRSDDKMVLEVQDNGQGIPKKYVDKLFRMFYRANERSEGSGLGLYIVKEVLNKLGGTIDVKSELGRGSSFKIQIPWKKEIEQPVDAKDHHN